MSRTSNPKAFASASAVSSIRRTSAPKGAFSPAGAACTEGMDTHFWMFAISSSR